MITFKLQFLQLCCRLLDKIILPPQAEAFSRPNAQTYDYLNRATYSKI